jgi:glucose/arabinose dehydrogenase
LVLVLGFLGAAVGSGHALRTQLVVSGLERPVFVTAPAGDARLFIVEQRGRILVLRDGELLPTPFLDIDPLVPDVGGADERGLLGLAFHPDYAANGFFYVNYIDLQNRTVVARYQVDADDPDVADPTSATILLVIPQPFANHNGGMMAFGPEDGYLYIGMGDGGSAGDPLNNAQNLGVLLGKMLRIDVDSGEPYAIPPDNPFVDDPQARDEIWAYGLRNPWRWSFDRLTGDLYIADVGQNAWEEIDYQPAGSPGGENYGWRLMEGTHCYEPPADCDDDSLTPPIFEYGHTGGACSVTGGYVYRGEAIPGLQGTYFFADWCNGKIWSFRYEGGQILEFTDRTAELDPGGGNAISFPSSFGEDGFGELYVVDWSPGPGGEVYRILPDASGALDPPAGAPSLRLGRVGPNPMRDHVRFRLDLGRSQRLRARILDPAGRLVRELFRGFLLPGVHTLRWDARDARGRRVASGTYLFSAETAVGTVVERILVLR